MRRYPAEDVRCSEDNTIRSWVTYADGTKLYFDWVIVDYAGFFTDDVGMPVPHPWDVGLAEDGSLTCAFIPTDRIFQQ